jgi:hypothetical protein
MSFTPRIVLIGDNQVQCVEIEAGIHIGDSCLTFCSYTDVSESKQDWLIPFRSKAFFKFTQYDGDMFFYVHDLTFGGAISEDWGVNVIRKLWSLNVRRRLLANPKSVINGSLNKHIRDLVLLSVEQELDLANLKDCVHLDALCYHGPFLYRITIEEAKDDPSSATMDDDVEFFGQDRDKPSQLKIMKISYSLTQISRGCVRFKFVHYPALGSQVLYWWQVLFPRDFDDVSRATFRSALQTKDTETWTEFQKALPREAPAPHTAHDIYESSLWEQWDE